MKTYGNYSCNYHSKPSEMGTMFTNLAKEINIHVFSGKSCLLPTVSILVTLGPCLFYATEFGLETL